MALVERAVCAKTAIFTLKAKGWTKNAICGILGNMQRESTISPARWQNGAEGNMANGFGLTQWTPATKYFNWAEKNSLYPIDMDSQLTRILFEVTTNDSEEKQYYPTSNYNFSFSEFTKSTKSAYDLGCAFAYNYERPADLANEAKLRGNYATNWYNFFS